VEALINIDVPDLERAVRFYEEAIGLRLRRRLFGDSAAEMLGAPCRIYLLVKAEGSPPIPGSDRTRSYDRHWTPVHLDFVVDDLDAAVERARRAGAKLEGALQSFAWGRFATLSDPFGHGLCFVQLSGRGYDEIE
jgi:predicted enzyme related to lactoylglutathione lyase